MEPDPWKSLDPLGEAVHFLRMSGVFYCRSEFTAPWALALPAFDNCVMFHIVTEGQCWLEVDGAANHLLRTPWTLASLAGRVGMSRSAFAERFTQLVGESAMHYVLKWKMHTASIWIKENDVTLSEVAARLGYESEAAFKRVVGVSPGAARTIPKL